VITGFEAYLVGLPEVVSVFVVSGDDDIVVHVAVPDIERLHAFLMDRLAARREVVTFRSSVIYRQTANRTLGPPEGYQPDGG
jgi:DNA-binding Lrp family transcriptional regulator